MPQLLKGTTYTTGASVTAENLNEHVDNAALLDGAISDQAAGGAPTASDKLLISQNNNLRQITVQTLFASPQPLGATTASAATVTTATVTGTLAVTGVTTLSDNLIANKGAIINENANDVDTRVEGTTDANLIYVDAGTNRVGIGTATPATKLDVNGAATITGATAITGATTVTGDTTLDGAVVINEAGANKDTRIEGDTDANLLMVDASADCVGIGTATPAKKLDVVGDVQVSGAILNSGVVKAFCQFATDNHVATADANKKFNIASVAATANANEYKITFTNAAPTAHLFAIGQAAQDNGNIWSIQTVSATVNDITFTILARDGGNTGSIDGTIWIAILGV